MNIERLKPGDLIYSCQDVGDHFEGRSVTIPQGIEGIFVRYYIRGLGPRMAEISIPTSPGQKTLECPAEDIRMFWRPRARTAWQRLMEDQDAA